MKKILAAFIVLLCVLCLYHFADTNTENKLTESVVEQEQIFPDSAESELPNTSKRDNNFRLVGYPIVAAPSSVENIDFVFVAEDSYCIFDGEKYGYITEDGEEITPCIYDIAYPFSEGLACVCQDGKYGYIDLTGETVIPFDFDRATPFVEGLAYFVVGNDYGFMDKTGTQVFSFECDSVSSFQEGLAYFSIDGRYGYIDQNGQIVIGPVFDDAGYFQHGLARVMKDGKYVVINREGEVLLEQYDSILSTEEGNYVYIEKDEKYGLADKEGNVLFEPLYDMISLLPGENLLLIREDELYGVVDMQTEVRIPAVYDYIRYDSYGDGTESGMLVLRDTDGNIESMNITQFFKVETEPEVHVQEVLREVYEALTEKGYNPVNQLVGYIMSGDPSYITSHKNARTVIMKVERDELVEEMLEQYIHSNGWNDK